MANKGQIQGRYSTGFKASVNEPPHKWKPLRRG